MERRVAERIEVEVQLGCRVPATPCRATMLDVSVYGCKLRLPHGGVEQGATAVIELPGTKGWQGHVMWSYRNTCGIKFNRRLRGAPAVALGLEEAAPEPVFADPLEGTRDANGGFLRHWVRRLTGCFS